jgi:hypothetical protein
MDEQSVVERAYAFVEDMFGLEHADKTAHTQLTPATPIIAQPADLASEDGMRHDPFTFKSVAEVYIENARRANGE